MKMAIIGSGPQALFCARHFDHLGAHVTLFQRGPLGGNITFLKERFPAFPVALNNEVLAAHDFFEKELVTLVNEIEEREIPQVGNVLRVHKRFLHPNEAVPGRTRLHDLYRVIYSTNPKDTILKQLEENPDFFKQLGDEVINSLHRPVESFADFDIVIEATGMGTAPNPMGAGKAHALNENNLKESSLLYYEKDIFTKLDLKDKKNIVLIGEGISQKLALLHMKEWLLSNPSNSLHWVTYAEARTSCGVEWLDSQVDTFLGEVQARFDKNKEQFEIKLREWRDLDDFVKVKIPKPVEPVPLLVIHEGYDVTSVDRLLDRKGVFATIESPDFRADAKKSSDMMTLSADALCIARGYKEEKLSESLQSEELGYYQLKNLNLKTLNHDLIEIEKKILNFFRRATEE
jgi:hypothetical protein